MTLANKLWIFITKQKLINITKSLNLKFKNYFPQLFSIMNGKLKTNINLLIFMVLAE